MAKKIEENIQLSAPEKLFELSQKLLACRAMQDKDLRRLVLGQLSQELTRNIQENNNPPGACQ